MSPQHTVRSAFQLNELDVLDHLRLSSGCSVWREDAIGIAVQYECRYRVASNVRTEVLDPRIDAGSRACRRRADRDVPVALDDPRAHELAARDIVVVEVVQK